MIFITAFGVLLIAAFIGSMFMTSYLARDDGVITLPEPTVSSGGSAGSDIGDSDDLDRIEITPETIQAVVATLSRPDVYSRNMQIGIYWAEDGEKKYSIDTAVRNRVTSLRSSSSPGVDKHIIITPDVIYIWHNGDAVPFSAGVSSPAQWYQLADEWQMLITYEDILTLDRSRIIEAGYVEYEGADCLYAVYLSPLFGHRITCYISIELGLVVAAEEYDNSGFLLYSMTAGATITGEADEAAFTLPDGTEVFE